MDSNMVLRASAALTQDETLTTVRVGPMNPQGGPLWLHVLVGAFTGTGDTIDVELEFCDEDATTTQVYNQNMKQITAAGLYHTPFWTDEEYLQVKLNTTDNDTDAGHSFAGVKVWISTSPLS
jgi:hypothetical protein